MIKAPLAFIAFILLLFIIVLFSYFSPSELQSVQKQTTAKLSTSTINFGSIPINTEKKSSFEIINSGDTPLIIYDIETSCGCTEVKWDKKPVKPGKKTKIEIIYKDRYPGMFMKTITVHGNVEESLVCKVCGKLVDKVER